MRTSLLFVALIVMVAAVVVAVEAFQFTPQACAFERENQSATDAGVTVTFGCRANRLLLVNDGANELYYTLSATTVGATNRLRLDPGLSVYLTIPSLDGIALDTTTAETTTYQIGAWK